MKRKIISGLETFSRRQIAKGSLHEDQHDLGHFADKSQGLALSHLQQQGLKGVTILEYPKLEEAYKGAPGPIPGFIQDHPQIKTFMKVLYKHFLNSSRLGAMTTSLGESVPVPNHSQVANLNTVLGSNSVSLVYLVG